MSQQLNYSTIYLWSFQENFWTPPSHRPPVSWRTYVGRWSVYPPDPWSAHHRRLHLLQLSLQRTSYSSNAEH